jgi:hypothetical protein
MKAILFLGSGVSFESGLPDTTKITNVLLKDEWHNHTDQNFYHGKQPNPHFRSTNLAPRLQKFLTIIKEASDEYLKKRRNTEANYEDLFYLCQQISDNEKYEIDNPAIAPFTDILKDKTQELCAAMPFEREINLGILASRSCDLIQCVVWHALYNRKTPKGLQFVIELVTNSRIEKLDIATLNHDLLIEQVLSNEHIQYIDGFGQPDGDVRFFEPELYEKHDAKINIFKLHGSINWYRFRIVEDGKTIDKYGCTTNIDYEHCRDSEGEMMQNLDHKPTFLTGSYNKMSDYGFGIFAKVHHKFLDRLSNCDIVIMSGYGWNDRGINGRLFEWILSSHRKRLILLHKDPEVEIKQKSKSAMWHRYDELVNDGRLIPIKKWLSETSINDITKVMNEFSEKLD